PVEPRAVLEPRLRRAGRLHRKRHAALLRDPTGAEHADLLALGIRERQPRPVRDGAPPHVPVLAPSGARKRRNDGSAAASASASSSSVYISHGMPSGSRAQNLSAFA